MKISAKLSYLRIAPRKTRLLADLVRGKSVKEAQTILSFTIKKGSSPVLKLLNQAVASAVNNYQLEPDNLYIAKIVVDEGPKYKRWRPRARGQAYQIQKKMSHIIIILDEKVKSKKKVDKSEKTAAVKKAEVKEQKAVKAGSEGKAGSKSEKSKPEQDSFRPKTERGAKRIFRRKAF